LIGKYILPWFGGTPAVWSTVLLFFQVLLIGGYAYAYWLIRKVNNKKIMHLVLLGTSLVVLIILGIIWTSPITPGESWKPVTPDFPVWKILELLFVSVGLPFFILSTNSPLMQAWFNQLYPLRSPYRLYALSNTGSLMALLSYPVLVEPYISLSMQGRIWSFSYVLFVLLIVYGTVKIMRKKTVLGRDPVPVKPKVIIRPDKRSKILWIALSTCASILLLATTNHITQDVAAIPLLWILPLAVYLISFILAFSSERWYPRQIYLILLFVVTMLFGMALILGQTVWFGIIWQLLVYLLTLFVCCMICHGELYRLRPHPEYLTSFYLMVAVGGAIGGIFVNFIAPYIFNGYWELPLGFVLCCLLLLTVMILDKKTSQTRQRFMLNYVFVIGAVILSSLVAYKYIDAVSVKDLGSWRNFYGIVRVRELDEKDWPSPAYLLIHGNTKHGFQLKEQSQSRIATAYFGDQSGVGLAIINHPNRGKGMKVGICGLGIGTLATYGQSGDVYRFYEINPSVIQLAQGESDYFTFMADSHAEVEVILGDARISLEQELAAGDKQDYDILVLDTFNSGSIPVHLLNVQAFEIYLSHLKPDGVLAINISNRFLDFVPVVWTLADHLELARQFISDPGNGTTTLPSDWMLLSADSSVLHVPAILDRAIQMKDYRTDIHLWTDDYSNLFQILK